MKANFGVIASCVVALAGMANASVIYTYAADQTTYTANVNSQVTVNLYLQEALNTSNSVISANGGLLSAGISVLRESVVPTSPAGLSNFSFDAFDFGGPTSIDQALTISGIQFSESIKLPGAGVALANTGGGAATGYANRIFLGSVNILTGSIANQSTHFDVFLNNVGGAGGYTLTKTKLLDLDISNATPAYTGVQDAGLTTFTVTTASTPEPGAISLGSVVIAILLLPRHRTRREFVRES